MEEIGETKRLDGVVIENRQGRDAGEDNCGIVTRQMNIMVKWVIAFKKLLLKLSSNPN